MRITKIPLLDLATHVQTDCQLSVRGTGMHPSAYMSTKVPFLEKNWPCSTSWPQMRLFRSVSVRKVNLALGQTEGIHLITSNHICPEIILTIISTFWLSMVFEGHSATPVGSKQRFHWKTQERPCQHLAPLVCWIWDPLAGIFSACDSTNLVMRPGVHTSVKGGKGGWMDEWMMANDPMNDGCFIGNCGYGMRSRIISMDTPQILCLV